MKVEVFAEWLRAQGTTVVKTASTYWERMGMGVYQAFPYHELIHPDQDELNEMFVAHGALALRYSLPLEAKMGMTSYHVVFDRPSYGFDDLSSYARKNVRRGLKNCSVEPISVERFVEEGWALRKDTLDRQGRQVALSFEDWSRKYLSTKGNDGFRFWGAIVKERLGAFLATCHIDDVCYYLYQQCHRDFLREHVNNALAFVVTQDAVNERKIPLVFYGTHSLDAPESVDEFKFRMGFQAKPVRQRVVLHPRYARFATGSAHSIVKTLSHWFPSNRNLSKAEGMLRFYREGLRP